MAWLASNATALNEGMQRRLEAVGKWSGMPEERRTHMDMAKLQVDPVGTESPVEVN